MELNLELILIIVGALFTAAFYLGWAKKDEVLEFDRDDKILHLAESLHSILKDIKVATPSKIDDMIDAALMALIYALKDKEGLVSLNETEKSKIREYVKDRLSKKDEP